MEGKGPLANRVQQAARTLVCQCYLLFSAGHAKLTAPWQNQYSFYDTAATYVCLYAVLSGPVAESQYPFDAKGIAAELVQV